MCGKTRGTWQKGIPSPNKKGRPHKSDEERNVDALCKSKTLAALAVIEEIMLYGKNESNRLRCAQYIIDRGWGKPKERIDANVDLVFADALIAAMQRDMQC